MRKDSDDQYNSYRHSSDEESTGAYMKTVKKNKKRMANGGASGNNGFMLQPDDVGDMASEADEETLRLLREQV